MIQTIAALAIWGLVLCLLPGARSRKDHTILIAAIAIATSLTLNVDPIYIVGDSALGGRNVLDLCANILMVVGIYYLSQAILRGAEVYDSPVQKDRVGLAVLGAVCLGLVLSFFLIKAPASSTKFMLDYGWQPAAAIYSAIQFVYIGLVVGVTGYVCFRFRRRMATLHFRVGFTFIGIGCGLAVVVVIAVLGMDAAHLLNELPLMEKLGSVYDASFAGAMLFLCAGLALPPVARRIVQRRQLRTQAALLKDLTTLWEDATAIRQEGRLAIPDGAIDAGDATTRKLHRMLVEIQDALLMDPHAAMLLSETDVRALIKAEDFLASIHARQDSGGRQARRGRRYGPRDG